MAFARLGGVPGRIRYDNLPAAVARVLRGPGPDRDRPLRRAALPLSASSPSSASRASGVPTRRAASRARWAASADATSCPCRGWPRLAELDALLAAADRKDERRHVDGRRETVGQAFEQERPHLRPAARRALRRRAARCAPGWTARPGCASGSAGTRCPPSLAGRRVDGPPGCPAPARSLHEGRVGRPPRAQSPEGQPDPRCSTTISRSSPASRVPCRPRSRSPRPGSRVPSRAPTSASGRGRAGGSATGRARGRSSRCCCSTARCPSSRSTPRSTRSSGSARPMPTLVAIEARRIADGGA